MPVLNKWDIYDKIMPCTQKGKHGMDCPGHPIWDPHRGQLIVAEDDARNQVVAAGRRFGKSYSGGNKLLPEVLFTKPLASTLLAEGRRREFWIVGPEFSDSEKEFRVIWNLLKRLEVPMDKGSVNNPEQGGMLIKCWDGALRIEAKSARYPERLVGEGLSGVILAEAAKLKDKVWFKYVRPTLADYNGWSYFSSTPEGKNWFYELWRKAQDPNNLGWSSFRMPAWINHHVYKTPTIEAHVNKLIELQRRYPGESVFKMAKQHKLVINEEILQSINDLPPEAFLQEIAADFTEFVGRVFKDFDEETHVTNLEWHPGWETYAAVDYGYHNPNVWLLIQLGPWGEINVFSEIYEEGLDPEDFADEIRWRRLNPPQLHRFYADPADPGASRILEKKLGIHSAGGTGGELNNRINHIRKALRESRYVKEDVDLEYGSRRPRLMFDRSCKRTIEDMLNYRYPDKRNSVSGETSAKRFDLPMKVSDHGPEALGRFFAGHFGQFGKPHTGMRIHQPDFSSQSASGLYLPSNAEEVEYSEKHPSNMRPLHREERREVFPKVNDALGAYMNGDYD